MSELPRSARIYWLLVVCSGVAVIAAAEANLAFDSYGAAVRTGVCVLVLAALAFVGERMAIPLLTFDESANHSIGSVASIAAIVILPWYAAVLVPPISIGLAQIKRPPVKSLFNMTNNTLALAAGTAVFALLGGQATLVSSSPATIVRALATMLAVSAVYYVCGTMFVATMIALVSRQKIWGIYRVNHMNTMLQEATTIGLGYMFGAFWLYNPAFAPLVALPLLMAYFSIETFVRIQQETRQSVLAMSESIDHRDPLTYNHSKRVAKLSVALAEDFGLSHEQIATIELSALVHDIGKIGIPSEILMKPGKLTPDERTQMELHPIIGYDMLRHYKQFRKGLGIVRWHHETWDGTGYPDKIPGPNIPVEARIVCIADAYEAMTADRPYRKAMTAEVAIERLEASAGTQFDPELVPIFRRACERIGELSEVDSLTEAEGGTPPPQPEPEPVRPRVPTAVTPLYRRAAIRRVPANSSRCRHVGVAVRTEADA